MCKKGQSFWLEWFLALPSSSMIPFRGFPETCFPPILHVQKSLESQEFYPRITQNFGLLFAGVWLQVWPDYLNANYLLAQLLSIIIIIFIILEHLPYCDRDTFYIV